MNVRRWVCSVGSRTDDADLEVAPSQLERRTRTAARVNGRERKTDIGILEADAVWEPKKRRGVGPRLPVYVGTCTSVVGMLLETLSTLD